MCVCVCVCVSVHFKPLKGICNVKHNEFALLFLNPTIVINLVVFLRFPDMCAA